MSGGEHAIGITVAAVARQPHRVFDAGKGCAVGGVHQQRTGGVRGRLFQGCAAPHRQFPLARRTMVMGRAAVAGKAFADKGLVHHSEHRRALVQQPDQGAPQRKARDEGFCAVDRSSTQTYSASSPSLPNSSPTMPCWGKLALISRRITASAARSASVTGSKSWLVLLLSMLSEVLKNGRMVSPEAVARRPMKAVKSMTVTAVP